MSSIKTYLENILSAVYGKDVRQAIHDAINQCYIDATIGITPQIDVRSITGGHAVDITLGDNTQTFNVMDGTPDVNPVVLFSTKTIASSTQLEKNSVSIPEISQYKIICVRCAVNNVIQYLTFYRVAGNDSQFLIDTNNVYTRGVFDVDWTENKVGVMWANGNDTTKTTVYFNKVIGVV